MQAGTEKQHNVELESFRLLKAHGIDTLPHSCFGRV